MAEYVSCAIAFLAGLLSFFTPCVLPLIPAYLSLISGLSIEQLGQGQGKKRNRVMGSILLFTLGFSFIFISLGASASTMGKFMVKNQQVLRSLGGVVVILFGLHILGIFKIKFLQYERRISLTQRPLHILGAFVVGMAFGLGWTPCIGPILASILALAATQETSYRGMFLLACFSAGLAVPFILAGLAVNKALNVFGQLKKYFKFFAIASGGVLILAGVLLISGVII